MQIQGDDLKQLETLLVREFRTTQALFDLVMDERDCLWRADVANLMELSGRKENLLNRLEALRRDQVHLLRTLNWNLPEQSPFSLTEALENLPPGEAARLLKIEQGIRTLFNQVREAAQVNHALAAHAIRKSVPLTEAPLAISRPEDLELPTLLASLVGAFDLLNQREESAVQAAIEHLQNALAQFGKLLERPGALQELDSSADTLLESNLVRKALVEQVTSLYRLRTAYQAVLDSNQRVLLGIAS